MTATDPPTGYDPDTWEMAVGVVADKIRFHDDNTNCTALGEDTTLQCADDVLRAALAVLDGGETEWALRFPGGGTSDPYTYRDNAEHSLAANPDAHVICRRVGPWIPAEVAQ